MVLTLSPWVPAAMRGATSAVMLLTIRYVDVRAISLQARRQDIASLHHTLRRRCQEPASAVSLGPVDDSRLCCILLATNGNGSSSSATTTLPLDENSRRRQPKLNLESELESQSGSDGRSGLYLRTDDCTWCRPGKYSRGTLHAEFCALGYPGTTRYELLEQAASERHRATVRASDWAPSVPPPTAQTELQHPTKR